MTRLSLVVLISGSGSNLQAIIDAIDKGQLNAEIRAVISNRPDAFGLQRAQKHGIEAIGLDHTAFNEREQFDQHLQQQIDRFQPDIVVLAGYMRILSEAFILHYSSRLINIHPSLLPKYQGLNTHQRALDNHDSIHGVSIHLVTPQLDAGPIIMQGQFPVEADDDVESLKHKAHQLEHQMYPKVLQWFAEQRLQINQGIPVFDNDTLQQPLLHNSL